MNKPNPGSKEAIAAGCTCPVLDNAHGKGYMGVKGVFAFSSNCKLHGFVKAETGTVPSIQSS